MGRNIFEIAVNVFETVCALGFVTFYLGTKYKKNTAIWIFILFSVFGTIELSMVNYITVFESIGTYLHLAVFFVYALAALKGKVMQKLWICIITQIVLTMDAVVTNIGLCCIIDYNPNDVILVFNGVRILAIIVSKIILVIAYVVILKNKSKDPSENSFWYKLILIPFFSVFAITNLMKVALIYPDVKEYILVGMLCIVAANIMVYYFYTLLRHEYENKIKISLLERDNENAKRSIREASVFTAEMRNVKHDIENHLLAISGLLHHDCKYEALEYIDGIHKNLPSSLKIIETGSPVLDAILNSKAAVCKQKGIFITISVEKHSLDNIDMTDIGILFGNLLDNALEASENTDEKRIGVEVCRTGMYLSIIVSNSIFESVLLKAEPFETTKSSKSDHGIGLKNVKRIVDKYNGIIDYYEQAGQLYCHIALENACLNK